MKRGGGSKKAGRGNRSGRGVSKGQKRAGAAKGRGKAKPGAEGAPQDARYSGPGPEQKRRKPDKPGAKAPQPMDTPQPAQVRNLDPPEEDALGSLLAQYGVEADGDWTRGRHLRVVARDDLDPRRRVVLVQEGLMRLVGVFEPQTVGLPVAHLARKGARLTLEGAVWIAPLAKKRVVEVNEKGETLFLYGRQLLSKSIKKTSGELQVGDEVLVVRSGGRRCIGIGLAHEGLALPPAKRQGDEVAVTNRLDLGRYLRDAQEVLE